MTIYSFIALFLGVSGEIAHDFHVSVCQMEYDEQSRALEISHRIFLDDLEEALILQYNDQKIDVLAPNNKQELDSLITDFILENFSISVNGKDTFPTVLGNQINGDVMNVYIEIKNIKKLKSLVIEHKLLMDLFPDQVNLIHFQKGQEKQSLKFDAKSLKQAIALE